MTNWTPEITARAAAAGVELHLSTRGTAGDQVVTLHLIRVSTEHRGAGLAARVLADLLTAADTHRATVALTPSNDFGANRARLTRWYRAAGFVPNTGRNRDYAISEAMIRLPR